MPRSRKQDANSSRAKPGSSSANSQNTSWLDLDERSWLDLDERSDEGESAGFQSSRHSSSRVFLPENSMGSSSPQFQGESANHFYPGSRSDFRAETPSDGFSPTTWSEHEIDSDTPVLPPNRPLEPQHTRHHSRRRRGGGRNTLAIRDTTREPVGPVSDIGANSRLSRTSVMSEDGSESRFPHTEADYQEALREMRRGESRHSESTGGHTQGWGIEDDPPDRRRRRPSAAHTYASRVSTLVEYDPENDPAYQDVYHLARNALAERGGYTERWDINPS